MTMWSPFRDFESLRRQIDHAFEEAGMGTMARWPLAFLPGRGARQYPLMNLYDDGDNLFVEALAPGVDQEKFDITVVGDTLSIAGEKMGLPDIPRERIHRNERAAGRFVRTVELPAQVDPNSVDAQYKNGLLLVKMARAESAKPRKIPVQAS